MNMTRSVKVCNYVLCSCLEINTKTVQWLLKSIEWIKFTVNKKVRNSHRVGICMEEKLVILHFDLRVTYVREDKKEHEHV